MMQLKKFSAFLPLATLAVGLGSLVPSPAWAGFLWVAPTEAAPPLADYSLKIIQRQRIILGIAFLVISGEAFG